MKILSVSLLAILLCSCQQDDTDKLQSQLTNLQDQINIISDKLEYKESQSTTEHYTATFSPSSQGYQILKTNAGFFIIYLDKVFQYANGYKVTFKIGNPNYMTSSDATLTVRWGKDYSTGTHYDDWLNSQHSENVDIDKSLLPGIWNSVDIILSPSTPDELSHIEVSMSINQIILKEENTSQ